MGRVLQAVVALFALLSVAAAQDAAAPATPPGGRLALVIGNGAYAKGALPTAANDAGLVAQTLTAAGFDVTGARDLDGESVRRAFREFLDKAGAAGPDGIAMVYLAGYGLQFDGENYFVPVDARMARETDIPLQAIRLADFVHALAALPLKARVVVLDGAYPDPNVPASDHVAAGLALMDPEPGTLIAFNAAPGTMGPAATGSYGVYGQALAEMMRAGGVAVEDVFGRVRLRVNQQTKGADVPWDTSKLTASFMFFDRAPDAPAVASAQQSLTAMNKRPIRDFPVEEAYNIAVARDTFPAYQDYVAAYPDSPYAARVRALLAIRREALIWRRTVSRNSPEAYWTYIRRYPRGPHIYDARRRLAILSAPVLPPPTFGLIDYDVPPPPEVEYRIVDAPTVYFDAPDYPPPPPPPVFFLPPPPVDFLVLPPPPPPVGPGFLPIPVPIPIPYARPIIQPGTLAPPQGVRGGYAQPRPFMTAPNGGGLVAQPAPPRPAAPAAPPAAAATVAPQIGGQTGAASLQRLPTPATSPAGRPLPQPGGTGQPVRPGPQGTPAAAGTSAGRAAVPELRPSQAPPPPAVRPAGQAVPAARPTQPQEPARPGASGSQPRLVPTPSRQRPVASPDPSIKATRPVAPATSPNVAPAPLQAQRPTTSPQGRPAPKAAPSATPPAPSAGPSNADVLHRQQQEQQNKVRQQQEQQRAQQQNQARQQQEQQRAQQQNQVRQQQEQQRAQPQHKEEPRKDCGHPGAPPCR